MLPTELLNITLIPASDLRDDFSAIPRDPGVYLFFLKDGNDLLNRTAYFETNRRKPLTMRRWLHLYTGAAQNLRTRIYQHLHSEEEENSSLRKTLLSLEFLFGALSKEGAPFGRDSSQEKLSEWLFQNALIGFELSNVPFVREQELIRRYGSPFNIAGRRANPYSRSLMRWRGEAFPPTRLKRFPVKKDH